ncbi:MAG: tRNA-dihydrouridine synthase [Candidatus Helarchaeota archaeon]|nr:tRNA-dihydrouridine synthase [Candidatus Helarchaeota archaeon]
MNDLSVKFMGLDFKTPFLLASGPATGALGEISKHCNELADNSWAGLVTKTIISKLPRYEMTPHLWSSRRFRYLGMTNVGPPMCLYSNGLMKTLKKDIESAHAAGLVIIPSIIGYSLEEWRSISKEIEDLGADALELNLSCPSPSDFIKNSMGGYLVGQNIELTRQVVEAICDVCKIPVMPKLTFHSPNIVESARACKHAGASAVSAINTIRGIIGINLDTGKLLCEGINRRTYLGGISGPIIKPFGLRAVAEIKIEVDDIEVCGMGGIDSWDSAVEYIMVGAGLVEICSAAMWYGYSLGNQLRNGLISFMKDKGYNSVSDFRGIALRDIDYKRDVQRSKTYPIINYEKCNLCKRCVRSCRDAAYDALFIEESKLKVNFERCECCGLCKVVCKDEAIQYESYK